MKLSIVIPAYNEQNYLGNCLDSIVKEIEGKKYDLEVIVVDNASTDNTTGIAKIYPKVKVISEPKKGLVNARKAGYNIATGELVANVDADTMLSPGWFDKVFYEFSKDEKLVALSGPFVLYDQGLRVNLMVRFFYYIGYIMYLLNRYVLNVGSMLQGGNYIVRRKAFDKAGGFNADIIFYGEDTDVARRLHKLGKVKFTFKLPIFASGRRLKAEGILLMGIRYGVNYFWTMFFKKPFNTEAEVDIRF